MSNDLVPYVVRQGDYLTKLAFVHGFDVDEVWKDPKNDDLRNLRKDHNILAPGDILYLPVKPKEGLAISKGDTNRYAAKVPTVDVKLAFSDHDGPLAGEPFEVRGCVVDGDPKADDKGGVTIKVAVTVREIEILFTQRHIKFLVRIGDMDPDTEMSGVRRRLENLGFYEHHHGESGDEAVHAAISVFQAANGIEPTGAPNKATLEALVGKQGL